MARRLWTQKEINHLKRKYANTVTKVIADQVGHSITSCYGMAGKLGLKKTEEFMKSHLAGGFTKGQRAGKRYEFKKGQAPWNKGKKLPGHSTPAMKRTQFKKGNKPQTYLPVGSMIVRDGGYLWEKVADPNKWRQYHRLVWEAHHGKVPRGMCVAFKPGADRMNPTIDDLELIPREENMRRNTIHNYPEEIKQAIRTVAKLNKAVRNAQKQT